MKTKSAWNIGRILAGSALLLSYSYSVGYAGTLHFNGTSAYVSVGPKPDLKVTGSSLTLEAWIKPTGRGSDVTEGGVILGKEGEYLLTRFADGTLRYAVATTTPGFIYINTFFPVPSNQWTHVALTYDGAFFRCYTNGVEIDSAPASGPIADADLTRNDFLIGTRQVATRYFQGQIDEVRVWNVTRSQADIQASMSRPLRGDEAGLLGYYRFDEGFGTTTADGTGRASTGTLLGGPLWDPASEALQVPVPITRSGALLTETAARLSASIGLNGPGHSNSFQLATSSSTALSFNGISNSVSFSLGPNTMYNVYPFTVTAWVRTAGQGAGGSTASSIVSKYVGGSLNGWSLYLLNGQIRAYYFRDAANYVWDGANGLNGGNVDDGQWHHVAFTAGTAEGRLYVDGVLTATNHWRGTPGPPTTIQPLVFGTNFAGQLDDVTLWQAELSRTAIAQLMTNPPTPAHPQYASLVAYWPLDEGAGQSASEAWSRTPAGILVSAPRWVPQARPLQYFATPLAPLSGTNSVLDLDGVDDHARVPAGIWFSNEFTIESWVYERSYNSHARVIDFGNGQGLHNVLLSLSSATTGRPYFYVYPANQGVSAPDPIPLNQWVHLAATLRSNTGTLYVNGVAVVSGTMTAPSAVPRGTNYIGRSHWADAYANALFDDLRLWNVARTPAQIRQSMTEPVSPADPSLLLNYRFDEPSGLTVVDYRSTSPKNGTLTNGASRLPFERSGMDLSNLSRGTRYHFRTVAANADTTEAGLIEGFATPTPAAGTALDFNGTNEFARIGGFGAAMPTTAVTVEFWQRAHSLQVQSTFGLEPDNTANRFQAHIPFVDGVVYWDFGNLGAGGRLAYLPPVSLIGQWNHFALVAKSPPSGYMRIYRNGVLEAQTNTASTYVSSVRDLVIGKLGTALFDGELDEFRIWNAARDEASIVRDFNRRLNGDEAGLVAYYRMDEGAGNALFDATGRGRDGLLLETNSPAWVPSTAPVGWPLVTAPEVTDIVQGDVTIGATVKGDSSQGTQVWIEYGQYAPVPNSAQNYFYGYQTNSSVVSLAQVNFNVPPTYAGTFPDMAFSVGDTAPPPEWPGGPGNYFAARYLGRIFLPATGYYTFYCASDDGSQLYVDGNLVVTNDGIHGLLERGASTNLAAGYHWLEARMFDYTNFAALTVSYAGPGIPKQVIPAAAFLRHDAVFTARTTPQSYAVAPGFQDFSAMATNIAGSSTSFVFRVVVANANGTNYGPEQTALMGTPGAFTALFFNGLGACVQVPGGTNLLAFPGTDAFTLEAWINPVSIGSTQTVVSKFNQPTNREYFLALNPQGRVVFNRQGSDFVSAGTVTPGQFIHVAATYDGTQRRIYLNGLLDPALDPGSGPITNSGAPFVIGARYWSNSLANFFQGVIDDVRVWQVPRSQTQIAADMNRRLSGYELGLIAYYRFDEAQGDFAVDSTVFGNAGVLRNGPVFVPGGMQFACTSAPPVLNIELLDFASGVILWWPITCNEYVLEEAADAGAPPDEWYPVLEPVTPVGDTYLIVVLLNRYENSFFRLRRL